VRPANVTASMRLARDPEVKRLCGGDGRDLTARWRAPCAACLRGA